ncbi:MAG: terminase small subunit [Cetobacterium sp.]|uniref:terminase small subunit n=1 Tax=Cetobacterium sp. TaxID=2071632 RepID=UPI003F3155E2
MDIKDKAKQLWLKAGGNNAEKGTLTLIAEELGVSQATVRSWKNRYKWENATGKSETKGKKKRNVAEKSESVTKEDKILKEEIKEVLLDNNLTEKQKNFCIEYMKSFNATQSAIKAGYAKSGAFVEGHRLLKNAKVRKYLEELKEMYAQEDYFETRRLLERHRQIAFADLRDYIGETGELKSLSDVDGTLIKKITVKSSFNSQGSSSSSSIELEDRSKSLDFLGKFYGLDPTVEMANKKHEMDKQKLNLSTKEKLEEWLLSLNEEQINELLEKMNNGK